MLGRIYEEGQWYCEVYHTRQEYEYLSACAVVSLTSAHPCYQCCPGGSDVVAGAGSMGGCEERKQEVVTGGFGVVLGGIRDEGQWLRRISHEMRVRIL